jgi:hypothetical protein
MHTTEQLNTALDGRYVIEHGRLRKSPIWASGLWNLNYVEQQHDPRVLEFVSQSLVSSRFMIQTAAENPTSSRPRTLERSKLLLRHPQPRGDD